MSKLGDLEANDTWTRQEYFLWHLKRFFSAECHQNPNSVTNISGNPTSMKTYLSK